MQRLGSFEKEHLPGLGPGDRFDPNPAVMRSPAVPTKKPRKRKARSPKTIKRYNDAAALKKKQKDDAMEKNLKAKTAESDAWRDAFVLAKDAAIAINQDLKQKDQTIDNLEIQQSQRDSQVRPPLYLDPSCAEILACCR